MRISLAALFSAVVLLLLSLSLSHGALVNTHVKRVIDVSGALIVTRSTISLKNFGSTSVNSFLLSLHPSHASHVHDLWVTLPTAPDRALPVETLAPDTHPDNALPADVGIALLVTLPNALAPDASLSVDVRMDVDSGLSPVPGRISGHDSQYMRYDGEIDFYSPYRTDVSETVIILGSSSITSHTEYPAPSSVSGKRVTLGPYEKLAAFSHRGVSIRFLNDRGFLVASSAVKTVDVTHWARLQVSEELQITNRAAAHEGEWSRIDHSHRYPSAYKTAVGDVWANLPNDAEGVVYRDLIGNITTSRLRRATKDKRPVQLTFRYPLMGGWKNHFWILYNVLHSRHVVSKGAVHTVSVPIWPSLNADLLCEDLLLKVVLPEWADDVTVDPHPSLQLEPDVSMERTSFALVKRPVVRLHAKMVRSQAKHARRVLIRYRYNGIMRWLSPLMYALSSLVVVVVSLSFFLSGLEAVGTSSGGTVNLTKKIQ